MYPSRAVLRLLAATLAVLLAGCSSSRPTGEPEPPALPATTETPPDFYYQPVAPDYCEQLQLDTLLVEIGFKVSGDSRDFDGRYYILPSPRATPTYLDVDPRRWEASCSLATIQDGQSYTHGKVIAEVYAYPEQARESYEFESSHPEAVEIQEIAGWWDEGTAYEVSNDTFATVSHHIYHENLSLNVWVTVYDRDPDAVRSTGHKIAAAVVNEAVNHLAQ